MQDYKLTQYSHGAGCGCKISPAVLEKILGGNEIDSFHDKLLVGSENKDDAAVYDLDGKNAIISTTDFFMPIVDDPNDFGAIAATNAISDIYAMGGQPLMAIAILGWPLDKLPIEIAGMVLDGARRICHDAGIPLAGGHSIDAPEPIFGLAVTGKASVEHIKKNNSAQPDDLIYLTKPLGIGLVTTAQKKGMADSGDLKQARDSMLKINDIGTTLGEVEGVHAVTDVTGFGLGGHLLEVCEGSGCSAKLDFASIPTFDFVDKYLALKTLPGGTGRNWSSYGEKIRLSDENQYRIIADPQTSGGLLITVSKDLKRQFEMHMQQHGYDIQAMGMITQKTNDEHLIEVS